MKFYAHSLEGRPEDEWEPLEVHLEQVADLAREFASKFGAGEWGYLAGLWHDLGKYQADFQKRLRGARIHAPHAGIGAALAATKDARRGLPLAFAIAGHHTGLTNAADSSLGRKPLGEVLREYAPLTTKLPAEAVQRAQIALPPLPNWLASQTTELFAITFFTRMLFSALVDADRLQTGAFYARAECRSASHELLNHEDLDKLRDRLDRFIDRKASDKPTQMNSLRGAVLAACRARASDSPGMFSLTVPTGGGKTLSAMSFGLRHAVANHLSRVIVVIPFTSIIEQNAKVYRDALGANGQVDQYNVLEHHSGVDEQKRQDENSEAELRRQTAAENWDAPIVVTTTVQFFESLLSDHPSCCRKLHNIAKSVVILDEVQTLPPGNLLAILESLRELVDHYGCTIVLSTATPPALQRREALPRGLEGVRPIIAEPQALFDSAAARRVDVEWRVSKVTPFAELAAEIAAHKSKQVLTIVHRRKDARDLAGLLPQATRFHLSALMCPAHRLQRIEEIRERLAKKKPCLVVSTQLIEAGVDVDFPVVYRALAGLDSLAQSAGRCNREGKISGLGEFIVFCAESEPPPGTLRKAMQATKRLLDLQGELPGGMLDPFNLEHARLFFQELYRMEELDRNKVITLLNGLSFASAARAFRMIDNDGMRPIAVTWGDGAARIEQFRRNPDIQTQRALQPYLVQVNQRYFDHLVARGIIEPWQDYLGLPTSLFKDWYDPEFGLNPDMDAAIAPDVMIT